MIFLTLIFIISGIFLFTLFLFFVLIPIFIGAPFDPTDKKTLRKMIDFSKIKKGEKIADLGSGDGRIVIEIAKIPLDLEVHGFEINPFLVWFSRRKIKKLGLQDKAFIHFGNFWKSNFSKYDIVFIFQVGFIMDKLEKKLKKELKKGSRVVLNTWNFSNWKIKKQEGKVYLYEV